MDDTQLQARAAASLAFWLEKLRLRALAALQAEFMERSAWLRRG